MKATIFLVLLLFAGLLLCLSQSLRQDIASPKRVLVKPAEENIFIDPSLESLTTPMTEYLQHNTLEDIFVWISPAIRVRYLVSEAHQENAAAAYTLYSLLARCEGVPSSREKLAQWLDKAILMNEPESLVEYTLTHFDSCIGIAQELKDRALVYLLQAAELGNVEAMEQVYFVHESDYMTSFGFRGLTREHYILKRDAFKSQKYTLLHQAVSNGSYHALALLGHAYQTFDPETRGVSHVKALGHYLAFLTFAQDNEQYNKVYDAAQQLQTKMLDEDILNATSEAENIIRNVRFLSRIE